MVLLDSERVSPLRFTIVATDISTDILNKAARAVYEDEKIGTIPVDFRRKYLLRSKDKPNDWCASPRKCETKSASAASTSWTISSSGSGWT
jgi:chemotaxis methyl-accepting protein methylase